MTESELRIKTVGGEEAKKTYKDITSYARELDKFASKSSLSPKEINAATAAQRNFNKEQANAVKLVKDLIRESKEYKKLADENAKRQNQVSRKTNRAEWFELERRGRYLEKSMERTNKRIMRVGEASQVGSEASGRIDETIAGQPGPGIRSMLGKFATDAAILYAGAKTIKTAIKDAVGFQNTLVGLSATMRGSARDTRGFISELNNPVSMMRLDAAHAGFGPGAVAEAAGQLAGTGGRVDQGGISSFLGTQRMGVDPSTILSLKSQQVKAGRDLGGNDMGMLLSDAVRSGLEDARRGEFIESTKNILNTLQNQGILVNAVKIGKMQAIYGASTYSDGHANPFFAGEQGGQRIAEFNQGFQNLPNNPGMLSFAMRALKFGKKGGPQTMRQLNDLLLGAVKDPSAMSSMMGEATKEFGDMGPEVLSQSPFFKGIFPTSLPAMRDLFTAKNSGRLRAAMMDPQMNGVQSPFQSLNDMTKSLVDKGGTPVATALNMQQATAFGENSLTTIGQGITQAGDIMIKTMTSVSAGLNKLNGALTPDVVKLMAIANNGTY